jgi:hypothetical protein
MGLACGRYGGGGGREKRMTYRVLVGKPDGNRALGRVVCVRQLRRMCVTLSILTAWFLAFRNKLRKNAVCGERVRVSGCDRV